MKEILVFVVFSALLFFGFVVMLIMAFIRKKKSFAIISFLLLLLCIGSVSRTIYMMASKSYRKVTGLFEPRTGDEIYHALFGQPCDCVKMLRAQDQEVPIIDYAIWLQAETCPEELERILRQHEYRSVIQVSNSVDWSVSQNSYDWFAPETLGDTIRVFVWEKDERIRQIIYSSMDSTRIFCVDMAK